MDGATFTSMAKRRGEWRIWWREWRSGEAAPRVGGVGIALDARVGHCIGVGGGSEKVAGGGGVFFADEELEAGAGPGEVLAHASGSVRLNHGSDASGIELCFGQIGLGAGVVGVHENEIGLVHREHYTPGGQREKVRRQRGQKVPCGYDACTMLAAWEREGRCGFCEV